jgi:hypothetical protein
MDFNRDVTLVKGPGSPPAVDRDSVQPKVVAEFHHRLGGRMDASGPPGQPDRGGMTMKLPFVRAQTRSIGYALAIAAALVASPAVAAGSGIEPAC